MASGAIQLIAQNTNQLAAGVQAVIDSLKRLEAQVAKNSKQASLFNQVFGNSAGFKAFLKSLNGLDPRKVNAFARAVEQIVKAASLLQATNLANNAAQINLVTAALKNLSTVNTDGIDRVAGSIFNALNLLGGVKASKNVESSINAIRSFINSYVSIGSKNIDITAVQNILFGPNGVMPTIRKIFADINALPAADKELTKRVSGSLNSISEIIRAYIAVSDKLSAQTVPPDLANIGKVLKDLFNGIFGPGGLGSIKITQEHVQTVQSIKAVFGILGGLEKFANFQKTVDSIKGFKFNESDFKPFFAFVQFISTSLSNIAGNIREDKIKSLSAVISSIGSITKTIPALLKLPDQIPGTIFSFGERFKRFLEFQKVFAIVAFVANNFSRIAGKLKKIEGAENLEAMTQGLSRIAKSIPALLRLSENLEGGFLQIVPRLKRFFQLRKLFLAIEQVVGPLARIAKKTSKAGGGSDSLTAMAELIKAIVQIAKESRGLTFDDKALSGFQKFTKQLADGLSNLTKLGFGSKDIKNLSSNMNQLQGVGAQIQKGLSVFDIAKGILIRDAVNIAVASLTKLTGSLLNSKTIITRTLIQLGDSIKDAGNRIADTGKRIVNELGVKRLVSSDTFADISQLDDLVTQMGVFAEEIPIDEAREFADIIGIKYPLSANDALKATLDLAKAGQDLVAIKGILPSSADLAALSESKDLDKATQFLIAAEGSFGEFARGVKATFDPKNIKVAADAVFAAANVSTASVDSLTSGLSKVGPAAKQFNLDLETTAAILAQFEDANIRGEEAGTLLRTVLQGFKTDKARDELNRLGVPLANADGTFRNLGEVIPDIARRYKELGLTQIQVADSVKQFGDTFAQQGLSILVSRNATQEYLSAMQKVPPANEAAEKSFSSLPGLFEQIRGSFETLMSKVFFPLVNRFFKPAANLILNFINAIAAIPKEVLEAVGTMILLGTVLASIAGSIVIVVGALTALGGILIQAGGALLFLYAKMPAIILGFTALASTLTTAIAVGAAFLTVLIAVSTAFNHVARILEDDIGGSGSAAKEFFTELYGLFKDMVGVIGEFTKGFFTFIGGVNSKLVQGEGAAITVFFKTLTNSIKGVRFALNELQEILGKINAIGFEKVLNPIGIIQLNFAIEALAKNKVFQFFFGEVDTSRAKNIVTELGFAFASIGFGLSQIKGGVIGIFTGEDAALAKAKRGVAALSAGIATIVSSLSGLDMTKSILAFRAGDIRKGAIEFASSLLDGIRDFLVSHRDFIVNTLEYLFNPIRTAKFVSDLLGLDALSEGLGQLSELFSFFFKGTLNTFFDLLSGTKSFDEAIIGNFGEKAKPFLELIKSISNAVGNFVGIFTDLLGLLFGTTGPQLIPGEGPLDQIYNVLAGIAKFVKPIFDLVSEFFIAVRSALPGLINVFKSFLTILEPVGGIITAIYKEVLRIITSIGELGERANIGTLIKEIIVSVVNVAQRIPAIIGDIIESLIEFFGFGNRIQENLEGGIASIDIIGIARDLLSKLLDAVKSVLNTLGQALFDAGEALGSDLLRGIGSFLSGFNFDFVGQIIDAIRMGNWRYLGDVIGGLIAGAITAAFNFLIGVINTLIPNVIQKVEETVNAQLFNTLSSVFRNIFSFISDFVINILNRVIVSVQDGLSRLLSTLGERIPALAGLFNLLGIAVNAVGYALRIFLNFIDAIIDLAGGLIQALLELPSVLQNVGGKLGFVSAIIAIIIAQQFGGVIIGMAASITQFLIPALLNWGQLLAFVARQALTVIAPIAGIAAAILSIVAVIKNLGTLLKGDVLRFLGDVLFDIGSFILKIFGVSDQQLLEIRSTLDSIVYFVNLAIRQIMVRLKRSVDQIGEDIKAQFDIGFQFKRKLATELFDQAAVKTGADFIDDITKEISDQTVKDALDKIVSVNADRIVQAAEEILRGVDFDSVDPADIENLVTVAAKTGVLHEVLFKANETAETLNGTFAVLVNSELPDLQQGARETFGTFVQNLALVKPQGDDLTETISILNTALEKGIIDQNDFNFALRRMGLVMAENGDIAVDTGEVVGEAADGAKKSWEELDETIKNVSDTLGTSVSKEASIISQLADNEKQQARHLEQLYKELFDAVDFGKIGQADADRYFDAVLQQMGILRQTERDKLNPFRNNNARVPGATGGDKAPASDIFGTDYEDYLKSLNLDSAPADQQINITPVMGDVGGGLDSIIPDASEIQQQSAEALEAQEEFLEKQAELNEQYDEKERNLNEQIAEDVQEHLREKKEAEDEFNITTERNAEAHRLALEKIDQSSSERLLDAVAQRDSAAAQAAVKGRNKEKRDSQAEFDRQEKQRKEDFDRDQLLAQQKAELRRSEQLAELVELQQERVIKLQALQQERDAEVKKNQDLVAITQQGTTRQFDVLRNFWNSSVAGTQQFASAISAQVANTFNGIAGSILNAMGGTSSGISNILNTLVRSIQSSPFGSLFSGITGALRNTALGPVVQAGDNALNSLVNGVSSIFNQASGNQQAGDLATGALGAIGQGIFSSLFGGNRRAGGNISGGRIYGVNEDGDELLGRGNKTWLMPSANGHIIPRAGRQNRSTGQGSISLTVDMSGMQVTGSNAIEIADIIETTVMTNIINIGKEVLTKK